MRANFAGVYNGVGVSPESSPDASGHSRAVYSTGAIIMSKAQDSKKAVKKEPAKTPKEKKEAKKIKKETMKRQ
jgi:hypothetical protein